MSISARLEELGIELPPVAAPVGAYVPALVVGDVVRTSGQLPLLDGELVSRGPLTISDTADTDPGYRAARQCALNALAAAAVAAGGVDRLASVMKVLGFVASDQAFYDQARIVNGASDLFGEIFGSAHTRSAVGVPMLPLNASVEIEVEFALAPLPAEVPVEDR